MTLPLPHAFMSLLLCTGLLLPGGSQAAPLPGAARPTPAETRPLPGTQGDAPRRLLVDASGATEERPGPSTRQGAPRGLRIAAEVGGGVLASAALTVGGGIVGSLICLVTDSDFTDAVCFVPLFFGVFGGAAFGLPLGVWWTGDRLGGDGSLLATMGGGAAGALLGTGILFLANDLDSTRLGRHPLVPALGIPLSALAGCVLGYELSQRSPHSLAARHGLQPLLAFTSGGALVGLGGQF